MVMQFTGTSPITNEEHLSTVYMTERNHMYRSSIQNSQTLLVINFYTIIFHVTSSL